MFVVTCCNNEFLLLTNGNKIKLRFCFTVMVVDIPLLISFV